MKNRVSILALACLACAIPIGLMADQTGPRKGDRGPGEHERYKTPGEFSPKEMEQARKEFNEFCKQHAHNRWLEYEKLPPQQRGRMIGMVMKFKSLQQLEKEDKELYSIRVRQIEVEDNEYGLLTDLKKVDKNDRPTADRLKTDLRANARQYVELRIKERSRRIEKLAKILEKEKENLTADSQAEDRLVEERVTQMLAEGPDFFNPKPYRRDADGVPVFPSSTTKTSVIKP